MPKVIKKTWAETEVQLAKENLISKDKGTVEGYSSLCIDTAKDIYDATTEILKSSSLTGNSATIAAGIAERLRKHLPIAPLTENDDEWIKSEIEAWPDTETWVNRRYPELWRYKKDGKWVYSDQSRIAGTEVSDQEHKLFRMGFLVDIADELMPIEMPYLPKEKPAGIVVTRSFNLENPEIKTTRPDTCAVIGLMSPTGEFRPVQIRRFFKWINGVKEEIDETEYMQRRTDFDIWFSNKLKKMEKEV